MLNIALLYMFYINLQAGTIVSKLESESLRENIKFKKNYELANQIS